MAAAATFENTGAMAYLGAASIYSKAYLAAAGSIFAIEARHASYLNILQNNPLSPGGENFETPYTAVQVASAVSGFVVSLNGGPPLTYSTTPSAANDVAILNFALARISRTGLLQHQCARIRLIAERPKWQDPP